MNIVHNFRETCIKSDIKRQESELLKYEDNADNSTEFEDNVDNSTEIEDNDYFKTENEENYVEKEDEDEKKDIVNDDIENATSGKI